MGGLALGLPSRTTDMLSRTSLSAIRALIYLGYSGRTVLSPKYIAHALEESPSYLAKILGQLTKAGILRATRGVNGGVQFSRPPDQISLLAIVEACQGVIVGNFCRHARDTATTCAYHQAMAELHGAIISVLSRWNLAQLINRPSPRTLDGHKLACLLQWAEVIHVKGKSGTSETRR
jgi:Rrf2 family protein